MSPTVCQRVIAAGMLMVAILVSPPVLIPGRAAPTKSAKTELVAFDNSPFPYSGQPPGQDKPFYDLERDGRRGHTSPRGGIYWEDLTYSDRRVLLHIPRGFNPALPALMIVYLHGNMTNLEGVVYRHQQVPRQVSESGLNAVLVAPQFAVNALDSSAGRFYEAGHLRRFVEEAGVRLARLNGDARARAAIESLPVILVAYSGGYAPAAWAVHHGGIGDRLRGVILLDALYAELDKFAAWIERRHSAFFFSAYSRSARDENAALQQLLAGRGIDFLSALPQRLGPGRIVFLATPEEVLHGEFVNRAWVDDPLRDVLARIPGYPRTPPPKARKR
ncbi:MAG TPA: alpha/beta hydrolase [Hyphomicrobiaceae bacterium]|nr:alpha/beta hydrolase [Hyphomicrobiaceae bacterium]